MSFKFSGHDTLELAKTYGTPLYVMSQDIIEDRVKRLQNGFESTGIDYRINYATKSFTTIGMLKLIGELGLGLDTASGGELFLALSSGVNPKMITLHGSNKSERELREAIEAQIGKIVIDSESELRRIERICADLDKEIDVFLRVNPGVEVHTNEMINTGKIDTKFGMAIEEIAPLAQRIDENSRLHLKGLHSHIGSQITEQEPFIEASKKMFKLYKDLKENGSDELEEVNLGGGFGIAYTKEENDFDPETFIPVLVEELKVLCKNLEIDLPRLSIEPGRYISGEAGITLYTVGTIKEVEGIRTYLSVDGGMADNPRPALYDAKYEARICDRELTEENKREVRICGKACENDILIDSIFLADPREGDVLAIFKTGAYNYTMASNYNKLPRPAVVLLKGDQADLLVKRESYDDLIKDDLLPEWLQLD